MLWLDERQVALRTVAEVISVWSGPLYICQFPPMAFARQGYETRLMPNTTCMPLRQRHTTWPKSRIHITPLFYQDETRARLRLVVKPEKPRNFPWQTRDEAMPRP
ncbi:hypothetical protein RRG08_006193 [Elysia crispata]|uniref:Uncharacterized protein n=1 Tax=Elysia crispata TaxID=231223 RepID=A0AAE1DRP5_9GAST|nr:hypothetical protein RRG08_006193 [Elysia crispata]